MQDKDKILIRKRFDRMIKHYNLSQKDLSLITGNTYGSVKTILNSENIPRWIMLSIFLFEYENNISNNDLGQKTPEQKIEELINEDCPNDEKVDLLHSFFTYGFEDYPLTVEQQKYVDLLKNRLG